MANIFFTPNTQKIISKLKDKKLEQKIAGARLKLEQNPLIGKKLSEKLDGQYSLRIWPYRIIYFLNNNRDVVITDVRHRKDIYR